MQGKGSISSLYQGIFNWRVSEASETLSIQVIIIYLYYLKHGHEPDAATTNKLTVLLLSCFILASSLAPSSVKLKEAFTT